jgi:hypothetical protein
MSTGVNLGPAESFLEALKSPSILVSRGELVARLINPPSASGIYAWYFSASPGEVPVETCHEFAQQFLMYVGIAPGRPHSRSNLRTRLRQHCRGNLKSSTLRRTIAALLESGEPTRTNFVESTARGNAADLDQRVSAWMDAHAKVCWVEAELPWLLEPALVTALAPPLNLDHNAQSAFRDRLKELRGNLERTLRSGAAT